MSSAPDDPESDSVPLTDAAWPPALTLGIETATPWGGAALLEGQGRLLGHLWACARTGYSRRLMPGIDSLLRDAHRKPADLSAIGVTVGPGSFTGVRIGLVTAKTLAQSLGVPLYTFSTLESLARRWPVKGEPIAVMLDARRKEIYSGVYRHGPDQTTEILRAPAVEKPESLVDALSAMDGPRIWLAGDAVEKFRSLWEAALEDRGEPVDIPWGLPGAESVARMAARAFKAGQAPTDPLMAVPDYLRSSDAIRGLQA
jgi:tRNA threonylcarbamoyladenosine biosynthesis protein TsaB